MSLGLTNRCRVFLADDHLIMREGLKRILEPEGFAVVGEAGEGHAAVAMCERLQPDVVVLDIGMPILNGVDAARQILKCCSQTRIILLTMHTDERYVLAGLQAGVSGYLLKSSTASRVLEAIKSVLKGDVYLSPEVSRVPVQAYLSNAGIPSDPLSLRERQVLQLLAEGKNTKEIGGILGISGRTAETHRSRIMQKLNIHDLAGLVRYAISEGLISVERRGSVTLRSVAAEAPPAGETDLAA